MPCEQVYEKTKFYIDSGGTCHCINNSSLVRDTCGKPTVVHTIASNSCLYGQRVETHRLGYNSHDANADNRVVIELDNVAYHPDFRINILSINKLYKAGCKTDETFKNLTLPSGTVIPIFEEPNGLYSITIDIFPEYVFSAASIDELTHRRSGHLIGNQKLKLTCPPCICNRKRAKSHKKKISPEYKPTKRNEVLHIDLCGPFSASALGNKYWTIIVDGYTHDIFIDPIKNKSDCVKSLEKYIEREGKPELIRSDNGSEFQGKFKNACIIYGIKRRYTCPYHPQQNGAAEVANRLILDTARCLLHDAGLNEKYWDFASKCASYLIQRHPRLVLNGKTSYEMKHNRKPSNKHLRVFGSKCYIKTLHPSNKFQKKFELGLFLGYDDIRPTYICQSLETGKYYKTRNVTFVEHDLEKPSVFDGLQNIDNSHGLNFIECHSVCFFDDSSVVDHSGRNHSESDMKFSDDCVDLFDDTFQKSEDLEINHDTVDVVGFSSNSDNMFNSLTHEVEYDFDSEVVQSMKDHYNKYFFNEMMCDSVNSTIRYSQKEALSGDDREKWLNGSQIEKDALYKLGCFEDISYSDLLRDDKIIPIVELYELKDNGTRHKVRGVCLGNRIDYSNSDFDTYSPVANLATVRLGLGIANQFDYETELFDISNAFINAPLVGERVVCKLPASWGGKIVLLKRALYGLRSAPKHWNREFNKHLLELGWNKSIHDPCLYTKDKLILIIFVDDCILIGNSEPVSKEKQLILRRFQGKEIKIDRSEPGKEKFVFLGLSVTRDRHRKTLSIDQIDMIERIIKKFQMEDCNVAKTPINSHNNNSGLDVPNFKY